MGTSPITAGVATTGYKGFLFLQKLSFKPKFVLTYNNEEANSDEYYVKTLEWCKDNDIDVITSKSSKMIDTLISRIDKLFVVGWQYLLRDHFEKLVVFHDSYLPKRRGFAPTVGALLNKEDYLGASCFQPLDVKNADPDYGLIYYRKEIPITHPLNLKDALEKVVDLYATMAGDILTKNPTPHEIDYAPSSFSLWRSSGDMRISWKKKAEEIHRKVLALGFPYDGATTIYDEQLIHLNEVEILLDKNFVNREDHIGKIWKLEGGCPHVVCGKDLIKILSASYQDGAVVRFNKLRRQFT